MKKFVTAVKEIENSNGEGDRGVPIKYDLDGRIMTAYKPHEGQLTFMLASLGRGQTDEQRYGAIVNIMMASHRDADQDHLASRLLTNVWKDRIHLRELEQIFEHLTEEWFADPTQSPSGSAESEPSDSENSQPTTT